MLGRTNGSTTAQPRLKICPLDAESLQGHPLGESPFIDSVLSNAGGISSLYVLAATATQDASKYFEILAQPLFTSRAVALSRKNKRPTTPQLVAGHVLLSSL